MRRQDREISSEGMTRTKSCGMPSGLSTSSSAPETVRFRTVQSMAAPPKAILPAFSTLFRGVDLFSAIATVSTKGQSTFFSAASPCFTMSPVVKRML